MEPLAALSSYNSVRLLRSFLHASLGINFYHFLTSQSINRLIGFVFAEKHYASFVKYLNALLSIQFSGPRLVTIFTASLANFAASRISLNFRLLGNQELLNCLLFANFEALGYVVE